jgi:RNA polymerase sigma-70 factor (ECF subfamily)
MTHGSQDAEDLAGWLAASYARSFRTACLLLGNRADAEEAVQEAFLRAWRFRASLGTGASLTPWLYRVVVNTCWSKLRTEVPHRDRRADASGLDGIVSTAISPEDSSESNELSRGLVRALGELSPQLRVVVVLRYYADLSDSEIAIAIGRRPGTVKSRLHEARSRLAANPALRELMVEDGEPAEEAFS